MTSRQSEKTNAILEEWRSAVNYEYDYEKLNITKEEEKALLEIAKRLMAAVDSRGDLEARDNDSEDFIEVPVWGVQKAMEEAYLLGRMNR